MLRGWLDEPTCVNCGRGVRPTLAAPPTQPEDKLTSTMERAARDAGRDFAAYARMAAADLDAAYHRPSAGKFKRRAPRTHCKHGHAWIPENLYNNGAKGQACAVCRREQSKRSSESRRAYYAERPCAVCGVAFRPIHADGVYCSRSCSAKAGAAARQLQTAAQ